MLHQDNWLPFLGPIALRPMISQGLPLHDCLNYYS